MAVSSQISAIVASQIGRIEGELEARIQLEATKMLNKFSNQCPDNDTLIKIIKTRNTLLTGVNSFQKKSNKFLRFVRTLRSAIRAANNIIRLLKINPSPVATGTPPNKDFGGLISAKTSGQLTSYADRLYTIRRVLEDLEGDVSSIESLVQGVSPSLNNVKNILENVNTKSQDCISQTGNSDELNNLLKEVQPLENTGSEGVPGENFLYKSVNGKNYVLGIIEDRGLESKIPRRVAVAKDNIGVIILRGEPSFSSDTKVLLDELKFRIDNQLP